MWKSIRKKRKLAALRQYGFCSFHIFRSWRSSKACADCLNCLHNSISHRVSQAPFTNKAERRRTDHAHPSGRHYQLITHNQGDSRKWKDGSRLYSTGKNAKAANSASTSVQRRFLLWILKSMPRATIPQASRIRRAASAARAAQRCVLTAVSASIS